MFKQFLLLVICLGFISHTHAFSLGLNLNISGNTAWLTEQLKYFKSYITSESFGNDMFNITVGVTCITLTTLCFVELYKAFSPDDTSAQEISELAISQSCKTCRHSNQNNHH